MKIDFTTRGAAWFKVCGVKIEDIYSCILEPDMHECIPYVDTAKRKFIPHELLSIAQGEEAKEGQHALLLHLKWTGNKEILVVRGIAQHGRWRRIGKKYELHAIEVDLVMRLREVLPSGTISRDSAMLHDIFLLIAKSFGALARGGNAKEMISVIKPRSRSDYVGIGSLGSFLYILYLDKYAAWANAEFVCGPTLLWESTSDRVSAKEDIDSQFRVVLRCCDELIDLVSRPHKEEDIQQWLERRPIFLDPTATHVWSKTKFGNKLVSDFVLRTAASSYVLVEIERADHEIFTKKKDRRGPLSHAIDQVVNWQLDVEERDALRVQSDLGLPEPMYAPKGMVVIGRSSAIVGNENKWNRIRVKEPLLFTYDELCDRVRATVRRMQETANLTSNNS